jgi:hypothetical protein
VSTITIMQNFLLEHCYNCGVAFAIPQDLVSVLKETHRCFYCPNGHAQQYMAESAAQKAERELAAERALHQRTQFLVMQAREETARLQRRISVGCCPCCNRNFQNLQRHMKTKHATFNVVAAPIQKVLK